MMDMSRTITVNIEERVDEEFRRFVASRYGKKKGALGKAVTAAMEELMKKADADIVSQGLKLLEKGIKMKKWKFNREELYDR
jgi:hypothetical protein